MRGTLLVFGFTFFIFFSPIPSEGQEPVRAGWKAGVARAVITPDDALWMAGYAARTKPSEGVLHDLWAKALVLEDENGKQAVCIAFDLSGMPKSMSDRIRERLYKKFQLSKSQI